MPVLELGVALAWVAESGVSSDGVFLLFRFVAALARIVHSLAGVVVAVVALVFQRDQPGLFGSGEDVPDLCRSGVVLSCNYVGNW